MNASLETIVPEAAFVYFNFTLEDPALEPQVHVPTLTEPYAEVVVESEVATLAVEIVIP